MNAESASKVTDDKKDEKMLRAAHTLARDSRFYSDAVRGFHDFLSWYVDNGDGTTTVIVCMRFDLGPDVPRWLFLSTVGFVSVFGMRSLVTQARKLHQTDALRAL